MKGTVKKFDDAKGFGFIIPEDAPEGTKDIFVHYSSIVQDGRKSLVEGQTVTFQVKDTNKGLQAFDVRVI